ncbi:CBS domain-containing protein [Rathayibacter sp. Leaf296]|uniref:CBS domain-containing protein n=1 Tax=Rathayibacter sp. Leaf296 TaxID=1736327 RepID=UPI00138EF269|nr:CBS domain-containing protein [Rathayibacter sp. Leaf296]
MTHESTNSPKIAFIPSATVRPVTFVKLNDPLSRATTLMKLHDFSQLPVVNGGGTRPVGAISWESIGQALSDDPRATLQDCVARDAPVMGLDDELLTAIEKINKTGFVIVTGPSGEISGIVTSADLGQALADIARPFVLVERCEGELRRIVVELLDSGPISRSEINALISRPKMTDSSSPSDLTFGDLVAVVTAQSVWSVLDTHYDRCRGQASAGQRFQTP